jgi:hypothetical protein
VGTISNDALDVAKEKYISGILFLIINLSFVLNLAICQKRPLDVSACLSTV